MKWVGMLVSFRDVNCQMAFGIPVFHLTCSEWNTNIFSHHTGLGSMNQIFFTITAEMYN